MADWSERAGAELGMDGEHVSDALLSAFINSEIDDDQVARAVREHVARCDVCRRELQELRAVVSLLAELPHPEPTRSFRLTPAMVPVRPVPRDQGFIRLQQGLRWASALAAVLLLLVFGTDIVIHRAGVPTEETMSTASEPAPAAIDRAADGPAAGAGGGLGAESYSETGSVEGPAAEAPAAEAPAAEAPAAARGNAGRAVPESAPAAAEEPTPAAAAFKAPAASPMPEADQAMPEISAQDEQSRRGWAISSGWVLAEVALAIIVVGLLVLSFALPRLYPWLRGRRSN